MFSRWEIAIHKMALVERLSEGVVKRGGAEKLP